MSEAMSNLYIALHQEKCGFTPTSNYGILRLCSLVIERDKYGRLRDRSPEVGIYATRGSRWKGTWALSDQATNRLWRDGHRLSRRGHSPESRGRAQGFLATTRRDTGLSASFCSRGACPRPA